MAWLIQSGDHLDWRVRGGVGTATPVLGPSLVRQTHWRGSAWAGLAITSSGTTGVQPGVRDSSASG